ncbi:MAG: hypothetical protein AAGF59_12395 [Pseudomonadota bacterium]
MTLAAFQEVIVALAGLVTVALGLFWFIQRQFTALRSTMTDCEAAAARDLAAFKLHVAETYLTRLSFDRFEHRFNERMDRLEGRLDKYFEDHGHR